MHQLNPRQRSFWFLAALLLVTVVAYSPLWRAEFITVDDPDYVTNNPVVQQGLTWRGVVWAFSGVRVANYHPVTWLSHMLDCQLFGLHSGAHHAVNVLLHLANVVLVFLVLRTMTGREGASAFVAAVFALHPLHVESVAWVSERKDVLSGFFWLLTIAAYTAYARASQHRGWWYGATLLFLTLGLLSKPMVVTLPCVLLLLDVWPLGRTRWVPAATVSTGQQPSTTTLRWLLLEKIPFLAVSIAVSAATFFAQSTSGAVATIESLPLSFRVGNALVSYVRYVGNFLWPSKLAAFYPLIKPWPVLMVAAAVAVLTVVTLVALLTLRKRPYLAIGWLWFVGTLVPVIGLVQVGNQAMADRYTYVPMIGLAMMIAWLAVDVVPSRFRAGLSVGGVLVLLACGAVTFNDSRGWIDSETLYRRSLARTEPNVFALFNVGMGQARREDHDGAIATLNQAVEMQPGNPHLRRALGYVLREAKRYDEAGQQLAMAIQADPKLATAWSEMGQLCLDLQEWEKAAEAYRRTVALRPDDLNSRMNLAVALRMSDRPELALAELRAAIQINPTVAKPWYLAGRLLLECDRADEAIEPLRRATALQPSLGDAHFRLGVALVRTRRGAEAISPLLSAVQLGAGGAGGAEAMSQLAWVLATHPDDHLRSGRDAHLLAERASRLTGADSPEALDALAAALAEQRQFPQAIETARRAAQIARSAGNDRLAEQIDSRASRYRAGQPVRDTSLAGVETGNVLP